RLPLSSREMLRLERQAIITTSVTHHLGVVFKPQKKPLFELTAKWLSGRRSRARFETGNPPRNRATCNFEEINAIDSRCDHWDTCLSRVGNEADFQLQEEYTRWEA